MTPVKVSYACRIMVLLRAGYVDTPMTGTSELDKLDHTKMMKPEDVAQVDPTFYLRP